MWKNHKVGGVLDTPLKHDKTFRVEGNETKDILFILQTWTQEQDYEA